jgi:hypothetical protein
MTRAHCHHLATGVVQDDHSKDTQRLLAEGEEVAYHHRGHGKVCPPRIKDAFGFDILGLHVSLASSVGI